MSTSEDFMDVNVPFIVRAQYIQDLSFENPNPLVAFTSEGDIQPDINVSVQAKATHLNERNFEVTLEIKVEAKRKNDVMFLIELVYSGVVTIANEIEGDALNHLVMVDVPHLLFPYARHIISTTTREGGYPPLMLSPVNFALLFQQQTKEGKGTVN